MFNKDEFARLLRLAKGERSINKYGLDAGVDPGYISRLLRGLIQTAPSASIIKKLGDRAHNGVTTHQLMVAAGYLEGSDIDIPPNGIPLDPAYIVMLPVVGRIAAGTPLTAIEEPGEYIPFDIRLAHLNGHRIDEFFFLRIKGDSMEPTISDRDIVLIRKQPIVENGEVAAVLCCEEDATVKRVTVAGDKIILNSDNTKYPPQVYEIKDCQIIGKVISRIGAVR